MVNERQTPELKFSFIRIKNIILTNYNLIEIVKERVQNKKKKQKQMNYAKAINRNRYYQYK